MEDEVLKEKAITILGFLNAFIIGVLFVILGVRCVRYLTNKDCTKDNVYAAPKFVAIKSDVLPGLCKFDISSEEDIGY